MKVLELAEGVSTVKIRSIKKQGELVYDGDPKDWEWRPSGIKNLFDQLNTLLGKSGRRFDRLIITKHFNERWFIAISHSTPEVVYYYYYSAHGKNSFVYIDWSKYKTEEFFALPPDKQLELLSTAVKPNIADIWKKERSIDTIGAALETMDKAEVDKVIDAHGSKFLNNISKMLVDTVSILKLAQFVHYLDKIGTQKTKKLASLSIETFKKAAIADITNEVRYGPVAVLRQATKLKKSGFDWPELENIVESLKDEFIKHFLKEIKSTGGSHPNIFLKWIGELKSLGHKWPELDIIEKSLRVGQVKETQASEEEQIAAVGQMSRNIRHIENPSEAVQLAAVKKNGASLRYIKNPSKDVIVTAILNLLKRDDNVFRTYYRDYKAKYPDWPEWAVIDQSLKGDNKK